MAEASVRLIDSGLVPDVDPAKFAALRAFVPGIAVEAVAQIRQELPDYVRPHDPRYAEIIEHAVEWVIDHFLDLMADPEASSAEILDFYRAIGVGEAREGRSLDTWQAAMRIGAAVAVGRLAEESERIGQGFTATATAQVAQAILVYVDQLAAATTAAHTEAGAKAGGELQSRRRTLLETLIEPAAAQLATIKELARDADWLLPRTVAAVALHERGRETHRPTLPPDVLVGLHLDQPCLVLPDPEGPGRRHQLETGLQDWLAAVGPTVEVTETARSLHWARQALSLAREGLIDRDKPITAEAHLPIMLMMQDRDLVERVAARRLAPLLKVPLPQRYRLAETLLACVECDFNATAVAARLHMHAQTIRYRLRQLETMFGDGMHDPARRLELHMVLHAWLATRPNPDAEPG